MSASLTVHNVVGIAVERVRLPRTNWIEIVITGSDGTQTTVSAFCSPEVKVEGAEGLNLTGEKDAA